MAAIVYILLPTQHHSFFRNLPPFLGCRFGFVVHTGSDYPYLLFVLNEIDKDISLLGVTLFGSKHHTNSVTIQVNNLREIQGNIFFPKQELLFIFFTGLQELNIIFFYSLTNPSL